MTMGELTRESKRAGARLFGVVFQILSVVAILGTAYATAQVANIGTQIGIGTSHDQAVWFVLVGGLFISFVLMGFGYTLGILCAIYDRQEPDVQQEDDGPTSTYRSPRPPSKPPEVGPWVVPSASPKPKTQTPPAPEMLTTEPPPDPTKESSLLWQQLTRERHFFGKRES